MATNVGTAFVDIKARLADDFSRELNKGIDSTERRLTSLGTTLTKVGAINALAGIAGQAVSLTAALLPAANAVYALPAAASVAGASFATLKTATAGMGDAFKAVADGDAKKLGEAMKGLSPNAQAFVQAGAAVYAQWKKVQAAVQQNFFAGLSTQLKNLATADLPLVKAGMSGVATGMNGMAKEAFAAMQTPLFKGAIVSAFGTAQTVVAQFTSILGPLLQAFANLSMVGGGFITRFTTWLTNAIGAKAAFLGSADGAWAMSAALKKAGDVISAVWSIGKNLVTTLLGIFHASDSSNMLASLVAITAQMSAWANSAKGQEQIKRVLESLDRIFQNFVNVLPSVVTAVGLVFGAFNSLPGPVKDASAQFAAWSIALGPALRGVAALSVGAKGLVSVVSMTGTVLSAVWSGMSAVASGAAYRMVADWVLLKYWALQYKLEAIRTWVATQIQAAKANAEMIATKVGVVGSWIAMGAAAVASAARQFGAWLLGVITGGALAVASMVVSVATIVGGWIVMGVQSLIGAAMVAAAWLLSIWPIALVIAAVIGLVILIIANWETIKNAIAAAWNWVAGVTGAAWDWIKGAVAGVVNWLAGVPGTIQGFFAGIWEGIKSAASGAWNWIKSSIESVVSWFAGVPGRITSSASGMWDGIKEAFKSAINWVIRKWNDFSISIPEVDTHIPGVGKVGGFSIDTPNIPELAKGGIGKGLTLVGEKGPELVNFSTASRVFPNDQLLKAIGGANSGPVEKHYHLHVEEGVRIKNPVVQEFAEMERLQLPL